MCLEYFDLSKIFEKVSSLLQPDGIFFFIVNYWWYPVNSTEIVGGIPYACQRMTLSELKKHFELHFPGELPDLEERYSYFHKGRHPTVGDYVDIADRVNLKLISAKRIIPNLEVSGRAAVGAKRLQRYKETQLSGVLADIHRFENKIALIDLETGWVMVAFRKIEPRDGVPPLQKGMHHRPTADRSGYV